MEIPEGHKLFICPDCKKEFIVPKKSKKQRCEICGKLRIKNKFAETRKKYYTLHNNDEIITMMAICPSCGKKHKIKTLPPDANITPRVRCPSCKSNLKKYPKKDPVCDGYSIGFF